jgi:hypothetical protein
MEIGTLSPDGHYQWDGTKWLPVQLTKISDDGFWMWNGSNWMPNPNQPHKTESTLDKVDNYFGQTNANVSPISTHETTTQPLMYILPKQKDRTVLWVSLSVIIPIVLVAFIVVLSGILYVWASGLSEEQDQTNLAGTWYNDADTMTLYSNGTVSESSGTISKWSVEGYNLTTTFLIDGEEIDLVWRYEIKTDSDGDRILFMAFYDVEDGVQTNEVADDSCAVYIDSVRAAEEENYVAKRAVFPEWCVQPEE